MQSYQISTLIITIAIKTCIGDLDNEVSTIILDTDTETETDTLLYTSYHSLSFISDNFYSKNEIDSTLSAYTNSTQLHVVFLFFHSKFKTHLLLYTYTTATQLYDDFYSKGYVNHMLVQSFTLFEFYCTKGDIDTLLADKVSNTGNVSLPGWLDIGTTYTTSRIRCNAVVHGHAGFAELKAASSYDMFSNLSTTRVNCGWVYHKINNDSYLLLSGSGQFIKHFKPIVASSDDILKESEVIIESACETLSKVRLQLRIRQKPNMENTDSTTWVKESGLIAQ